MTNMKIRIETEFSIRTRVTIIPLDLKGTVTAIFIGDDGLTFRIKYYDGNIPRNEYFYESEIALIPTE